MDCIDHSITDDAPADHAARHGWLRAGTRCWRWRCAPACWCSITGRPWSRNAESALYRDDDPLTRRRFAVDSWFNDNGQPAS